MKNTLTLFIALFLISYTLLGQAPDLVNYQAVARDLTGIPLENVSVSVQYDIRSGSSAGTIIYSESHATTTNQFGLFTAQIGGGSVLSGNFSTINWGTNLHYLQVTINGDVMPAAQLLSVPYALHANTATSGVPGANGHNNLADSVAEAPGANCVNGGYRINMGVDDNDDGVLQTGEIDISYYICNGLNGAVNNNDTSATNELQTLSISNDTVFLSNGGFAVLPTAIGDNDWQVTANDITSMPIGNVGIGIPTPGHKLSVGSSDTVIASFVGTDPNAAILSVYGVNSNAAVGAIFLNGSDSGVVLLDPSQNAFYLMNTTVNGNLGIVTDSTIVLNSTVIANESDLTYNLVDSIFTYSGSANPVVHVNQGMFITDSLYVIGNNFNQPNWVLANDGIGQAKWTDPSTLFSGGLWTQGTGDVYNTTDSIGIGVVNPIAPLHVAGGGLGNPIALFEKGGFLSANIHVNNTGSNGSGIVFQNGGTNTGSISSTTSNVLNLNAQVVEVGISPQTAKFNVAHSSSTSSPTMELHESTAGFSRIKHTNSVANKYWITEAGINANDANSGYSIGYENGSGTVLPFIVYGDSKVGVNNLAAPLASFHVMDTNATGGGVVSEGFDQAGLLVAARNNFSSPNRGAIISGDQIGKVIFPGYAGGAYGDGPQIRANATENYTSAANGSELVFQTIPNGSVSHVDALRLTNDGKAEIPVGLLIPTGAANNYVLTSDAVGNASWKTAVSTSLWSTNAGNVYPTTLADRVGIGTNSPSGKLEIFNTTEDSALVVNSSASKTSLTQLIVGTNSGTGSGDKYGARLTTNGLGGSNNYGGYFSVSGGAVSNAALGAFASGNLGNRMGLYATVGGAGTGTTYGIYGQNSSSTSGVVYGGYFQTLSNTGSVIYGVRSDVNSSSSSNQYGFYTSINTSSGGTKYGVYAYVDQGSTNWAAYFAKGDVYIADNLVIPTGAGAGKVLTSDASGTASWKTGHIAFEAHPASATQAFTNATQQLDLSVAGLNHGGGYATASSEFIAPVTGVYSFQSSVTLKDLTTSPDLDFVMEMLKNNVVVKSSTEILTSTSIITITINSTLELTAGDIVKLQAYHNIAGGYSAAVTSIEGTWFSGHLVYAN